MAEEKYNRKNPAVKRILQEVKEMQANPSDDFTSLPLEENIFEWQFAICGPRDTEFEGGIYHGRIQLPAEYPFKPPAFMLLTPNGRFMTQTKICLSISNYHPEHWQPSWSVRTALVALIAFMPTDPNGALGSLDFNKEERRALAIKSRKAAPKYGSPGRQKLIDEIHRDMLNKARVPQLASTVCSDESTDNLKTEAEAGSSNGTAVVTVGDAPDPPPEAEHQVVENVHEVHLNANAGSLRAGISAGVRSSRNPSLEIRAQQNQQQQQLQGTDDRIYTWAAVGFMVAILFLLVKKYLKAHGLAGYQNGL